MPASKQNNQAWSYMKHHFDWQLCLRVHHVRNDRMTGRPSTLISVISVTVAIMIYSLLRFFDVLPVCLPFGLWLEKACRQKGAPNMLLFQQVCLFLGTQWHESRTSVLIRKGDEQHSAWITVGVWTFNGRFIVCEIFIALWTLAVLNFREKTLQEKIVKPIRCYSIWHN